MDDLARQQIIDAGRGHLVGGRSEARVSTSDVMNETIGRATNDDLERTVAVWFKHEDEDERTFAPVGPIWLQVAGVAPNEENPYGGADRELVPFAKPDVPEWFSKGTAVALAKELGVTVVES
jgi:hypothetical protein